MKKSSKRVARIGGAFATAALAATYFAGCAQATPEPDEVTEQAAAADSVSIEDAWVKAAESGMTSAFGMLSNDSGQSVTVTSVESEASESMELHEIVDGTMREVEGGFEIPASGQLSLDPGGNHLMLMDLTAPLLAGDEATFTLTFSDGSHFQFDAVVKDYSGANESYDDADHGHDHAGHDHEEHDH